MKNYATEQLRNIALIGHGSTGKTSLVEAMLSRAGAISRTGKVEDGTATTDFDPEEEKRKCLPAMDNGAYGPAMAITEPDSGSDVSAIRATAIRDGDEYVINGSKTYITNALSADFIMVAVKTDPSKRGLSLVIVEADRPGLIRGRNLKKMGSKGAETGEVAFDNVRVPVDNLMGQEGGGMSIMLGGIDIDRIMFPLIGYARATRAYEETVEFVKNRKGFGQRIFDFQNTQFKLADIKAELVVGRAFLDDVIRDYKETGALDPLKCAVAKLWVCEMEGRVIDACVQMHGGAGYMDEYNVSRFYTAARVHRIFAGTSEIMRMIIARTI